MLIEKIIGREVLDSRGNPTVEAEVHTKEIIARAIAPSGASRGKYEAYELRDNEKRFFGRGVAKAVKNINEIISPSLKGLDVREQDIIDKKMIEIDGTENKNKLGGNAIVAVSMAVMKAAALSEKKELYEYLNGKSIPVPMLNLINGGKHAGNNLAIQEFLIIPVGAKSFKEAITLSSEIYILLGIKLSEKYGKEAKNVGDEGGYAGGKIRDTDEALSLLSWCIEELGYKNKVFLGLDAAASSFYDEKKEKYKIDGKLLSREEMLEYYLDFVKSYKIISIEDPFYENDFDAFSEIKKKIGDKVNIVGDDLLVTNPKRLKIAIEKNAVNTLLLKVNQIGTVSESLEVVKMCKNNNIKIVVSHRSGDSEDTFIADFSVGINANFIKAGAPARGERTSKYNQLLRIEERGIKYNECG